MFSLRFYIFLFVYISDLKFNTINFPFQSSLALDFTYVLKNEDEPKDCQKDLPEVTFVSTW